MRIEEGGGRMLLGDNTGGEAVMIQPISFQCVGFCISNGLPRIYDVQFRVVQS